MLGFDQFTNLVLLVTAIWLCIITAAFLCVAVSWLGSMWHRHTGRQCPECDYHADQADMLIHRTLEHWHDHS